MRDLEIRGAGNLLGTRQSGHIAAVGFELYCQMLADAVSRLKSQQEGAQRPPQTARTPTITLPLPAYLPDTYVGHLNTRLRLYRRIADASHVDEVEQIGQELADRFGDMPAPVTNLLYLGRIRVLAAQAGVRSVSMQSRQVIVRPEIMDGFAIPDHYRHAAKMGPTQIRLDTRSLGKNWKQALEEILARKAAISADSSLALSPR
jgi:transcription-repair coupling factor (superfamily II helicase)